MVFPKHAFMRSSVPYSTLLPNRCEAFRKMVLSEIAPDANGKYIYDAEITRVIDGDTVDVRLDHGCGLYSIQRCRLLGINTPEMVGEHKAAGILAKEHLRGLLAQADPLIARTHLDKQGSFRRLLVELWDGDVCINQRMIDDGFAEQYKG